MQLGLFAEAGGLLRDVGIVDISISGANDDAGALVAFGDNVTIFNCFAIGKIALSSGPLAGGLVAAGSGTIDLSHAGVAISVPSTVTAGGLVGDSEFGISRSYATGDVKGGKRLRPSEVWSATRVLFKGRLRDLMQQATLPEAKNSNVGGIVGLAAGTPPIIYSYAEGVVKGGSNSTVGGSVGLSSVKVESSYSTGPVKGKEAGGFSGSGGAGLSSDYWDTDTSGKGKGAGCGGAKCGRGAKGLTTEQFQSGLPAGFDPKIWGQKKNINGGYPYLLALPPK